MISFILLHQINLQNQLIYVVIVTVKLQTKQYSQQFVLKMNQSSMVVICYEMTE